MSSSFQLQTDRASVGTELWEALKEKCKALALHFPDVPELFCKQQHLQHRPLPLTVGLAQQRKSRDRIEIAAQSYEGNVLE